MMQRKVLDVQTIMPMKVTLGAKQSREFDPSGVLAVPPTDSQEEIKAAMSEFIKQYKNGDIQISYP